MDADKKVKEYHQKVEQLQTEKIGIACKHHAEISIGYITRLYGIYPPRAEGPEAVRLRLTVWFTRTREMYGHT